MSLSPITLRFFRNTVLALGKNKMVKEASSDVALETQEI
jgi:hypothetical protein